VTSHDEDLHSERIKLLHDFRAAVLRWHHRDYTHADQNDLRLYINRNLVAAHQAVHEAGVIRYITVTPPLLTGGPVMRLDPFDMVCEQMHGQGFALDVVNSIDQAIGVYEHLRDDTGMVHLPSREVVDIETSIRRALRPSFRRVPPNSEAEVQDAVEDILNAIGVEHVREKEVAPVGPRGFHPDFTAEEHGLAIEVKLATEKHGPSAIQEELAADIAAYRTKWKRLLAVIYDTGVIADPYQMERDNMKHFGVSVIIVKH